DVRVKPRRVAERRKLAGTCVMFARPQRARPPRVGMPSHQAVGEQHGDVRPRRGKEDMSETGAVETGDDRGFAEYPYEIGEGMGGRTDDLEPVAGEERLDRGLVDRPAALRPGVTSRHVDAPRSGTDVSG